MPRIDEPPRRRDRPLQALRIGDQFRCLPGGSFEGGLLLERLEHGDCKVRVKSMTGVEQDIWWSGGAPVLLGGEPVPVTPASAPPATATAVRAAQADRRRTEVLTRKEAKAVAKKIAAVPPAPPPKRPAPSGDEL